MGLPIPFGGLLPEVNVHGGTVKTVPYAADVAAVCGGKSAYEAWWGGLDAITGGWYSGLKDVK